MTTSSLPYRTNLKNTYSVLEVLGQGGFGITYKVLHQELKKEMCVKELFVSGVSTRGQHNTLISQNIGEFTFDDFKQRFIQEAQQLAKFNHHNIVRVIDLFEENNTAYMVMEYENGLTLKKNIEQQGVLSVESSFNIMHQLLNAVEEVHKQGMLHRDIKPDNIIIKPNGNVVLIDFGSARYFGEGKTITQTAMLTPGYAPKEQYSTRAKRGAFSDIYSLGATFYFLLTGKKPIPSIDREEEKLEAPHVINPKISSQISSAIMLAMELKAEDRFQSIDEFRNALDTLASERLEVKESIIIGQSVSKKLVNTIVDIDSNQYGEIKVGDQVWLSSNLNVSRFTDGFDLLYAKTDEDWIKASERRIPAYCYYNYDENNSEKYGKLYNFYAVSNHRSLIPKNYRLPDKSDFEKLVNNFGGFESAGKRLRDENDFLLFNLGGARNKSGLYACQEMEGYFWVNEEASTDKAWVFEIFSYCDSVRFIYQNKGYGFSVRCIKI